MFIARFPVSGEGEDLLELGTRLVRLLALRAGDALHLGAAIRLMRELGSRRLRFASADEEQADAAEAEGIRVIRFSLRVEHSPAAVR